MRIAPAIWAMALLGATSVGRAEPVDGLALPHKDVTVSSPVQEIIAEVKVMEGDTVQANQILARLRNEKEAAEHNRYVQIVKKREFDFKAASALASDRIGSREKALETEIELTLARIDVDLSRQKLEEKTIRSPITGVVIKNHKESGESVDRVEALFQIVDVSKLYLQFHVEPQTAEKIRKDQKVKFCTQLHPDRQHEAVVDFVSPAADAASGLFRVKLLYDNAEGKIRAGTRVTAQFGE